jgi:hypothetical protein
VIEASFFSGTPYVQRSKILFFSVTVKQDTHFILEHADHTFIIIASMGRTRERRHDIIENKSVDKACVAFAGCRTRNVKRLLAGSDLVACWNKTAIADTEPTHHLRCSEISLFWQSQKHGS